MTGTEETMEQRKRTVETVRRQRMYDALKRIASYTPPEKMRRFGVAEWGLDDANEAIEMAYENVLQEAKDAIRGMRRPKADAGPHVKADVNINCNGGRRRP